MYVAKLVAKLQTKSIPLESSTPATYRVPRTAETVRDVKEHLHYFKNDVFHKYSAVEQIICRIEDDQGRLLEYFVPTRWGYESTFTCPHCQTEHSLPYDGVECRNCHQMMNNGGHPMWIDYPEQPLPEDA